LVSTAKVFGRSKFGFQDISTRVACAIGGGRAGLGKGESYKNEIEDKGISGSRSKKLGIKVIFGIAWGKDIREGSGKHTRKREDATMTEGWGKAKNFTQRRQLGPRKGRRRPEKELMEKTRQYILKKVPTEPLRRLLGGNAVN